jgi:predicted RNA binding protein with dsRBD fold (UPF0201 family)
VVKYVYKAKKMRKCVLEELNHIPKEPLPQGELRAMYWTQRMHSLDRKTTIAQTAREVLEKCIAYLKKDHPNFEFKYDEEFFGNIR